MKIKDLFNINKCLKQKENQLKMKEEKLKELEEKIKMLELIYNDNFMNNNDTIDISNVYVVNLNDIKYITYAADSECFTYYYNIFSDKLMVLLYKDPGVLFSHYEPDIQLPKHISRVSKEVNVYSDGMVPKGLLQYLYYKMNNITLDMVQNVCNLEYKNQ